MGSLSVSTHRRLVHWQGLLLVVSLLHFWFVPTTSQRNTWLKNVAEGEDVLLSILDNSPDVTRIVWYRGEDLVKDVIAFLKQIPNYHIRAPQNGRVSMNYDGSLLIKNVTLMDAGIYTVEVKTRNSKTITECGELNVYRHVRKPTLQVRSSTITGRMHGVVLICYSNARTIQWLFNGSKLQLTERMNLSKDDRRLIIDPVKREDSGSYQCEASNPISSATSVALELDVKF